MRIEGLIMVVNGHIAEKRVFHNLTTGTIFTFSLISLPMYLLYVV